MIFFCMHVQIKQISVKISAHFAHVVYFFSRLYVLLKTNHHYLCTGSMCCLRKYITLVSSQKQQDTPETEINEVNNVLSWKQFLHKCQICSCDVLSQEGWGENSPVKFAITGCTFSSKNGFYK